LASYSEDKKPLLFYLSKRGFYLSFIREFSNPAGTESLRLYSFGGAGHKGQNGGKDQTKGSDQVGVVEILIGIVDPAASERPRRKKFPPKKP